MEELVPQTDLRQYDGCFYMHVVMLLLMLQRSPRLAYIHDHCVGYRGNNDGFLQIHGQVQRPSIHVEGYHRVAQGVFSESDCLYRRWMARVMKVHVKSRIW